VAVGEVSGCALSIAGLDPGGGAGLAADLRGFAAAGAFGCAVAAVLTVQSTSGLSATHPVPAAQVVAQAREVLAHQNVRAMKTGALGTADNVRAVGDLLAVHADIPSIVDPVLLPTRGKGRLLAERAIEAVRARLVPRAALVTANVPEAEALLGRRVTSLDDAHEAALALVALGADAALVKGGHLTGAEAVDVLALGGDTLELRARRLKLPPVHGGGCLLASLVAGRLARDPRAYRDEGPMMLVDALRWAKRVHHRALGHAVDVGGELRVLVPEPLKTSATSAAARRSRPRARRPRG
jgi:hydroxymethylpyrimidine/phosphomethylpyrimidine kinase